MTGEASRVEQRGGPEDPGFAGHLPGPRPRARFCTCIFIRVIVSPTLQMREQRPSSVDPSSILQGRCAEEPELRT